VAVYQLKSPEMFNNYRHLFIGVLWVLFLYGTAWSQTSEQKSKSDEAMAHDSLFVKSLVSKYINSINKADTSLGSALWAHTSEVSFISPRGNEYGWNGIKNIYGFFKDNFSDRKLTCTNLRFANYGEVIWLEFFWVFDATMNPDNKTVQTKGRETQIWKKVNTDWKLVHVHYSGMPLTAEAQGL
jgi:hypothetical protein